MNYCQGISKEKVESIVIHHFNELSSSYDEKSKNRECYNSAINRIIVEKLKNVSSAKILDVGCGTGTRALEILKNVSNYEYYGCDISEQMVCKAKEAGLINVEVASVTKLPYHDGEFDVVMSLFNVLGYLYDKADLEKAFYEISRVSKRNAIIIIDVMNKKHRGEGLKFHRGVLRRGVTLMKSYFYFHRSFGQLFEMDINGEKLQGYVRGFNIQDIRKAVRHTDLAIKKAQVIGYDSGREHQDIHKGQLLFELAHVSNEQI